MGGSPIRLSFLFIFFFARTRHRVLGEVPFLHSCSFAFACRFFVISFLRLTGNVKSKLVDGGPFFKIPIGLFTFKYTNLCNGACGSVPADLNMFLHVWNPFGKSMESWSEPGYSGTSDSSGGVPGAPRGPQGPQGPIFI